MVKMQTKIIFVVVFVFGTILSMIRTESTEEKEILLDFTRKIPHSCMIDWSMDLSDFITGLGSM